MSTIQAHEAAISTATVEIKTLMVSNRQMTLAIFRQLEENWAWAEPGDPLYGLEAPVHLWGRVNYHFPGCSNRPGPHEHVVFSANGVLYRCTVHGNQTPWQFSQAIRLPQLFIGS